jgi:hypothetical protein
MSSGNVGRFRRVIAHVLLCQLLPTVVGRHTQSNVDRGWLLGESRNHYIPMDGKECNVGWKRQSQEPSDKAGPTIGWPHRRDRPTGLEMSAPVPVGDSAASPMLHRRASALCRRHRHPTLPIVTVKVTAAVGVLTKQPLTPQFSLPQLQHHLRPSPASPPCPTCCAARTMAQSMAASLPAVIATVLPVLQIDETKAYHEVTSSAESTTSNF